MTTSSISKPKLLLVWIGLERSVALTGVVIMVDFTPCEPNSFAMSMRGNLWPGAIYGRKENRKYEAADESWFPSGLTRE